MSPNWPAAPYSAEQAAETRQPPLSMPNAEMLNTDDRINVAFAFAMDAPISVTSG
jgi:hypothetical protein